MAQQHQLLVIDNPEKLLHVSTRRTFLKTLAAGGTIVMLPSLFGARGAGSEVNPSAWRNGIQLDLSTDTGILNYAFALEQFEAAFYTAVVASAGFRTFTPEQQEVFADLRNHEVIHREFLRAALGKSAIPAIELNRTALATATGDIATVLRSAESLEDLGVSAFNGAGKYLTDAAHLTLAGKIVSVEARHAAAIRDMRDAMGVATGAAAGTRFAGDDVVKPPGDAYQGLDVKLEPGAVLTRAAATGLLSTPVSIAKPPRAAKGTPDSGPPSPTP